MQTGNAAPRSVKSNLDYALYYADHGWKVLPLNGITEDGYCTCGKTDCDRKGKHPFTPHVRRGVKDATLRQDKVRGWYRNLSRLNVGVATGPDSVGVVIDVDRKGFEAASRLKERVPELALTLRQKTGSGGFHFVFRTDKTYRNSPICTGIDVRGAGGYVVAAASLHASGKRYEWQKRPILGVPESLDEILELTSEKQACDSLTCGAEIPYGVQHNVLISILGRLRSWGFSPAEMLAVAERMSEDRFEKPMTTAQLKERVVSVARYSVGDYNIGSLVDEELSRQSLIDEAS